MRVSRWGNSLAIRLPASVVQALELKEGEEVEIHVAGARQFEISRKPNREELLKRLRAFRGRFLLTSSSTVTRRKTARWRWGSSGPKVDNSEAVVPNATATD